MARQYSLIKRAVQGIPGLREGLARAFTYLPKPLSVKAYALLRRHVFKDNARRMQTFALAFDQAILAAKGGDIAYYEFGVARGTSVIAAYGIARDKGVSPAIYAFDSFRGLPSDESDFVKGDMAYPQAVFRRFIDKAGVPLSRVTTVPGFFDASLTPELKQKLGLAPGVAVFHNDSDLYESTRSVLDWIDSLAAIGSVLIFDDWYSFAHEADPSRFGEQRAFHEWKGNVNWDVLRAEPESNIAFVRVR